MCLSAPARQQHNVWYNGLQITGIAVDESTGDVFFSDAAANRVVHQTRNGSLVRVYAESGLYSPIQLEYWGGWLYVADSVNARVVAIEVSTGAVHSSMAQRYLGSCSGLAVNTLTSDVLVLDGWGLRTQVWAPAWTAGSEAWRFWNDLSAMVLSPRYLASVSLMPDPTDMVTRFTTDPTQSLLYSYYDESRHGSLELRARQRGATAQQWTDNYGGGLYLLSQPAPDAPMQVAVMLATGTLFDEWTAPGTGGKAVPFYGWAMHVDSEGAQYISDHGESADSSPYGRVVKLARNGLSGDNHGSCCHHAVPLLSFISCKAQGVW